MRMKFYPKRWSRYETLTLSSELSLALWALVLVLLLPAKLAEGSNASPENASPQVVWSEAQRIDFEILLLRTELAVLDDDVMALQRHMRRLESIRAPEHYALRLQALNTSWQRIKATLPAAHIARQSRAEFASAASARNIVILLPLSGRYAEASLSLLNPLQSALPDDSTFVIDTDLYQDMSELWELVRLFSPELIIGPLEADKAQAFVEQDFQIPTILFTQIEHSQPHIRSLKPSLLSHAHHLLAQLEHKAGLNIVWLTDGSESAQKLVEMVELSYSATTGMPVSSQSASIEQGLDRALSGLIGAHESKARAAWLQRTLQRNIEFNEYVRKDQPILIALVPQRTALQIAPLLDFYQNPLHLVWLPTQLPDLQQFLQTKKQWQNTWALLPGHFLVDLKSFYNKNGDEEKLGLFYALGALAVEMIRQSRQNLPYLGEFEFGQLEIFEDGRYGLVPQLYFLHNGKMEQANRLPSVDD